MGPLSGPFDLHPEEITEGRWVDPTGMDEMLREDPAQFAGALRLLWSQHRAEIVAGIG
jgi:hypothetical protein